MVFYSQEMAGDHAWGAYDVICTALWQQSGHFGRKHCWTHSSTVFPLFLKGLGYNQQFVIVQERVTSTPDAILSVEWDCISHNLKLGKP